MKISENKNFLKVETTNYQFEMNELLGLSKTNHLSEERATRLNKVLTFVHDSDQIDRVFWCDKGHHDGAELHCVTTSGLIFILNERKFLNGIPCLITVLLGRPNQVARLYEAVGETAPEDIIDWCIYYQWYGLNNI